MLCSGHVSERELKEWSGQGVVTSLHIVGRVAVGWHVVVTTSWKQGNFALVNTRGKRPRHFISMDRLLAYLDRSGVSSQYFLINVGELTFSSTKE